MNLIICAMLMLLTVSSDPTDSVVDRVGVKGPLTFGGTKFGLVWTDSPSAMYRIQEYLPAGETLESFRQMLTIHVFDVEMETKAVVDQKVRELLARKKTDPFCNYMVTTSPDEKEYMVDFLLSDSKSEDADPTLLEFNVYRIKKIAYPDGKGAILVYAFTKRAYNDDILSFLDALKDERVEYLSEMIKTDLPTITR